MWCFIINYVCHHIIADRLSSSVTFHELTAIILLFTFCSVRYNMLIDSFADARSSSCIFLKSKEKKIFNSFMICSWLSVVIKLFFLIKDDVLSKYKSLVKSMYLTACHIFVLLNRKLCQCAFFWFWIASWYIFAAFLT